MVHFEIKNLNFRYPEGEKQVLKNINLTVKSGEYIALCGKSGCGKTTLLRHLKTALTPHGERSGDILFCGKPLEEADLRTQSSQIGFVMQNPDNQIVTDKVWHELAFGLESLGLENSTIRLRVGEMASYFGIQDWFHKDVSQLSGGQKQLLNLASIMAMQPKILVLDEPTSLLDPIAAADFLNTVKKINAELGTTVILSEHRLEDVLPNADRAVVMEKGEIIADDNPVKIGEILKEKQSKMFCAMPSPMQIFYGVNGKGSCPLTVRDGRNWLSGAAKDKDISYTKIEEKCENIQKECVLELKEVWFRYEKELPDILRDVNLQVEKGDFHALMGGNGTGKTTLLKAVCGICKIYRGKIFINGKKFEKYKQGELFENCIALLPQDPQNIFVKKNVLEDLIEMVEEKSLSKEEKEKMLNDVAEKCEIFHILQSHPYDISGGELQRAALAKVLLCSPKILLMDEPTKGMDNFFKTKFADILKKLKDDGVTILMVSHDIEFCAKYADKVSMFFDGGIITTNTPNKFFAQNSFYTTAANRMSRHIFENAVTNEDVEFLYAQNKLGENV